MKFLKSYNQLIQEKNQSLTLYHGSPYVIKEFKNQTTYFTDDVDFAIGYAEDKSMAQEMDAEAKLYKVKVNTNLFNINDKEDFDKLEKVLPSKVSYAYNNFGFEAEIPKEEIMYNMTGYDIIKPNEKAVKANIGDLVPDPFYEPEKYIIVKKDEEFAYGYSRKELRYDTENFKKDPFSIRSSNDTYKKLHKNLYGQIKDIIRKDLDKTYVDSQDVNYALVSSHGGYDMLGLEDDTKNRIKSIWDDTISNWKSGLKDSKHLKKFEIKERVQKLQETWRFYENKTVVEAIKKLGYGGYIAKEKDVDTYAIFNPSTDVTIIEYQIPHGSTYNSWDDYQNYLSYNKEIAQLFKKGSEYEGYSMSNRRDIYNLYKSGLDVEKAKKEILSNKDKYLWKWKYV